MKLYVDRSYVNSPKAWIKLTGTASGSQAFGDKGSRISEIPHSLRQHTVTRRRAVELGRFRGMRKVRGEV